MWERIKEFLGFGVSKELPTSEEQKAMMDIYKVEPNIRELFEIEQAINLPVIIVEDKKTSKKIPVKKILVEEPVKPKRHWYNNKKHNKLVPEGTKPPKGYKKGRCKTKKKDK